MSNFCTGHPSLVEFPVLLALQEGLAGDRLVGVSGILNGTCNYILTPDGTANVSFDAALAEAQQFGFAEADPSSDVNGDDAAAKLAILAQVALKAWTHSPTRSAPRQSPTSKPSTSLTRANSDCTIRQVSRAQLRSDASSSPSVEPALVPLSSSLAQVQGSQNVVVASGKYGGNTAFIGHGAGGHPTAVAVISDLIAARKVAVTPTGSFHNDRKPLRRSAAISPLRTTFASS